MRLPAVSVALLALLSLTLAFADATQRRAKQHSGHFIVPLLLSGGNAATASGRSGDAGTGRGLMAKLTMFKSMFQQPQSNVIIIRPTAPTSLTTFTTTGSLARDSANTGRRDSNDDVDADAAPTGQPLLDEAYEDLPPPVVLGTNGVHDKLAVGVRRNQHNNNSKRQQHISSYNRPVVLRNSSDNNKGSDHNRNNKHAPAKRRRQGNSRRKRKHKVVRAENGSSGNNNNNGDSIVNMGPNVSGISTNNNKNNNNNGIFDLNANARIQSIVNAFRRQQTPTVYNH